MPSLSNNNMLYHLRDINLMTGINGAYTYVHEWTQTHTLLVLLAGTVLIDKDESRYEMKREMIYYYAPNTMLMVWPRGANSSVFRIEFESLVQQEDGLYIPQAELMQLENGMKLKLMEQGLKLAQQMHRQWQSTELGHQLLAHAGLYELLHHILKAPDDPTSQSPDLLVKLEQSRLYMQLHYHNPIKVTDLAAQMDVSTKYYMELFRRNYATSAIQYLTDIRMEAARRLLARGATTMRSVAEAVGFKDEFYFSRRFKQENGVSPTNFMKSRKRKIALMDTSLIGLVLPLHYVPMVAPLHPLWRAYYYQEVGELLSFQLSIGRDNKTIEANIKLLCQSTEQIDYIIYPDYFNEQQIEQLRQTGSQLYRVDFNGQTWTQQLTLLAEFLSAEVEAQRWLTEYENKAKAAKQILKERLENRTFQFLLIEGDTCYKCYDRGIVETVFGELELQSASIIKVDSKVAVTIEQLLEINADYLMLLIYQDEETMAYWRELQQHEVWAELKAVRTGCVHSLLPFPWRDYAPLPMELMIQEMLECVPTAIYP